MYFRDSLKFSRIDIDSVVHKDKIPNELIAVEIQLKNNDKMLFSVVYRSPNSTSENNVNIQDVLKNLISKKFSHVCIVGDFNYPNINWKDWTLYNSLNDGGV